MYLNFTPVKTITQNLKKLTGLAGMIALLALTLSACVKNNGATTVVQPQAALEVIDASPDAPALDFYVDATKITAEPLTLGTYTSYFSGNSGINTAFFFQEGSSILIAKDSIDLIAGKYYSLFLANVKATPDVILFSDTLTNPTTGNAGLRFIDLSPDAPKVNLVIKGGSTLVSNATYKSYTSFLNVPVSANDTLQVVQSGTTTVLYTFPLIRLQANTEYTVWLYGLANTTVQSEQLAMGVMENAYFNE